MEREPGAMEGLAGIIIRIIMKTGFWRDRSVFVTGATGLVGGWLTKHLLEQGAPVTALVRDWVPASEFVHQGLADRLNVVRGGLSSPYLLERVLGEYEIEVVFHLAAQTIVGIANRNPLSTFESNIRGTWNLLEAYRRSPMVKSVILASSDKAYGDQKVLPYKEDMPLQGKHPYDVSKSCADLIAQSYAHTFGVPLAITRCGNFYGGGDLNWNRIVPGTIRSVIRGEPPIIRSDGTFVRDYFYVEDGAATYLALAEALAHKAELRGESFNFSNESPMTVIEIVDRILALMGTDLKAEIRNEATNEIRAQYLSAEKARKLLDWAPLYTMDDGLSRTITWYGDFFRRAA